MIDRVKWVKFGAFCAIFITAVIAASWADAPVAAPCTTDSDCAERYGGDGSPYPTGWLDPDLEYATWQDV